jgi:hypothetical protein
MVSAPRLHTSAAHSPAGDGNQAIKTWPAVSLYLLVAWLAAGGRWSGASPAVTQARSLINRIPRRTSRLRLPEHSPGRRRRST